MSPFHLESNGSDCSLHLCGDVTVEHARDLHSALVAALADGATLHIDAREVTRLDAAAVQLLMAAAHAAAHTEIVDLSGAWTQAFQRFGLANRVLSPSPAR